MTVPQITDIVTLEEPFIRGTADAGNPAPMGDWFFFFYKKQKDIDIFKKKE